MAEIYPFRGVRYNQSMVKDLSAVICPPYDIITPQLEQELYRQNQYNFIRIEHNQRLPQDSTLDNKYTRSAAILEEWLKQGVLITDGASGWKSGTRILSALMKVRWLSLRVTV
jgi:uncharacterized protein (DUF1015 family)